MEGYDKVSAILAGLIVDSNYRWSWGTLAAPQHCTVDLLRRVNSIWIRRLTWGDNYMTSGDLRNFKVFVSRQPSS